LELYVAIELALFFVQIVICFLHIIVTFVPFIEMDVAEPLVEAGSSLVVNCSVRGQITRRAGDDGYIGDCHLGYNESINRSNLISVCRRRIGDVCS